jgi:hypothetical protein
MGGFMSRLLTLLITTVVAAGLAVGITYVQGIPIRAGQQKTVELIGDNVKLCETANLKKSNRQIASLDGTIGIIDAKKMRFYDDYQAGLPDARQVKTPSELAGIICLREMKTEVEVAKYGSITSTKRYTCTRYGRDLEAWLFDVKAKKLLAYRVFEGTQPPECPDKTDSNLTKTGNLPPVADIADWLN